MTISRPIALTLLLGWLVLAGCVVLSTLAINQLRKDRQFLLQHCTFSR